MFFHHILISFSFSPLQRVISMKIQTRRYLPFSEGLSSHPKSPNQTPNPLHLWLYVSAPTIFPLLSLPCLSWTCLASYHLRPSHLLISSTPDILTGLSRTDLLRRSIQITHGPSLRDYLKPYGSPHRLSLSLLYSFSPQQGDLQRETLWTVVWLL